jgi:VanZ family protein
LKKVIKRWIPLLVWVVIIFGLPFVSHLSAKDVDLPIHYDKVVHFVEYAVFAVLFYRGMSYYDSRVKPVSVLVVIISSIGVGAIDELHQSFMPARHPSLMDLTADIAGIITGTFVAMVLHSRALRRIKEG